MYNTIVCAIVVVMLASTVVAKPRNNQTNGQTRESSIAGGNCDSTEPFPADVRKRAEKGLNMAGPSTAAGAKREVNAFA